MKMMGGHGDDVHGGHMALQAGGIFCSAAASLLLARTDFLVDDLFSVVVFLFICLLFCASFLSLLFDSPLVFDSPDNTVECLVFLKVGVVALLMMDAEVYIFPLRARSSFLLLLVMSLAPTDICWVCVCMYYVPEL
jgi:hypothetical protein